MAGVRVSGVALHVRFRHPLHSKKYGSILSVLEDITLGGPAPSSYYWAQYYHDDSDLVLTAEVTAARSNTFISAFAPILEFSLVFTALWPQMSKAMSEAIRRDESAVRVLSAQEHVYIRTLIVENCEMRNKNARIAANPYAYTYIYLSARESTPCRSGPRAVSVPPAGGVWGEANIYTHV
jgi:hypothetical protein